VKSLLLLLCWGCAPFIMPDLKVVHGTLTTVQHEDRYEPICNGITRAISKDCVNAPRSFHAQVTDTTGHREWFWFFLVPDSVQNEWPVSVKLQPGYTATWRLHKTTLWLLPCVRVCQYDIDYALNGDRDVTP
jgi:hypothetical protein